MDEEEGEGREVGRERSERWRRGGPTWPLVIPGERPKPSMERPTRILVDFTGAEGSMLPWREGW